MAEFEHHESFEATEATGHLSLDRYEDVYQQLFSEALEDGVITEEERKKLNAAAGELGLDEGRLRALEQALRAAYEAHHGISVLDTGQMFAPRTTVSRGVDFVTSVAPPPAPQGQAPSEEVAALHARVAFLEARVRELELELDEAKNQIAYDIDLGEIDAPVPSMVLDEPAALHRRLRHDPRDSAILDGLYLAHMNDPDRRWCVAHALAYLGAANEEQRVYHSENKPHGLIQPTAALGADAWRRLLLHPDDDVLTADVLGTVVTAVLLAHSAALKAAGQLPTIDPSRRLDPATSTVTAARCFDWAAKSLGMSAPQLYANPEGDFVTSVMPTVPPLCVLGKHALSGRSADELAFLAGQRLAYYRPERFIRLLVPGVADLQDLFLAALLIGNPKLPLNTQVRARVAPIAGAIEPVLESRDVDALRAGYQHFVEHGGVANLQRFTVGSDATAMRAGFVLCPNLGVAERMAELQGQKPDAVVDDLIVFLTSDAYASLRGQMGIAVTA
ncbi:MAG: hypothetical protein R3B72_15830 [Polyangiaceae bacterium]